MLGTNTILVALGAFLASAVEMVEALTIVLGVGVVRGWRAPLTGAAVAAVTLGALVAVLGPALDAVPINALRLVVGALLLTFGLQWLRKAILRSSGFKPLHDENEAFREQRERAAGASQTKKAGLDWYGFTVAFKGVLLEGLEVVFIVIAFGSAQGELGLAILGAVAAFVLVVIGRAARTRAALQGAREHDQVRSRPVAHQLRLLLGRRGRRRRVAGGRGLTARRHRVLRSGVVRLVLALRRQRLVPAVAGADA